MLLRRSLVKLLIGLALLGHAANLLIFTTAGLTRGRPPIIPVDLVESPGIFADTMPQALVLTAIVIGLGVIAFALALAFRVYTVIGSDDLDDMITTDKDL
jgi:multicomponent Na+:H+ antiporter subunit C